MNEDLDLPVTTKALVLASIPSKPQEKDKRGQKSTYHSKSSSSVRHTYIEEYTSSYCTCFVDIDIEMGIHIKHYSMGPCGHTSKTKLVGRIPFTGMIARYDHMPYQTDSLPIQDADVSQPVSKWRD
jgi:hypothetical protein